MTNTYRFTDLVEQGHDQNFVRAQIGAGVFDRVRHGGYAVELSQDRPEDRHFAMIKTTTPLLNDDSVISHSSAALMWGLPVPRRLLAKVHVTWDRASGGHLRRWTHTHACPLTQAELSEIGGVRVTSIARTAVDTALLCQNHEALQIMDAAWRALGSADELAAVCDAAFRRPGIRTARWALEHADPSSESAGESLSRYWMITNGVPMPRLQVDIRDENGHFVARPDFAWDDCRVLGEFDGRSKYAVDGADGSAADVVMREKRRENQLRALGWWVYRWTWNDLADGRRFAAKLQQFLRSNPLRRGG